MLTEREIQKLPAPDRGSKIYYDTKHGSRAGGVPGFGVKVTDQGARSFIVAYWIAGRQKRYTIGRYPEWQIAAARDRAKQIKRGTEQGVDPLAKRQAERAAATVRELCERFEREYLPKRRPSTQTGYKSIINAHLLPAWGNRKAASITLDDTEKLHRDITTGKQSARGQPAPVRANRVKGYGSKIFAQGIRWRMVKENPFRGIEMNAENKRRRYFSQAEIVAIGEALDAYPAQVAADCIRLTMLTGCRPGEARIARWEDIDLERGVWTMPGATTKQKTEHRAPLSAPALELLQRMRKERPDSEYVFPGRRKTEPLTQIHSVWRFVRDHAKLKDARAHDLRHTYASILASGGMSLPLIGALLGHTQPATTQRYAHLFDEPLKEAAELVGRYITSAAKPSADVVPMKGRGDG